MKKIFLLMSFILLTSCSQGVNNPQSTWDNDTKQVINTQDKIQNTNTLVWNLPNIYTESVDFNTCVAQNIDQCVADFKSQNPDTTSCDDFITQDSRNACNITEITARAIQEESVDICDDLQVWVDGCKNEVVVNIWKKSWDVSNCEILSDWYINSCKNKIITQNAITTRDTSLCDTLIAPEWSDIFEIDICKEEVIMQIENDEQEAQIEQEQRIQDEQEQIQNQNSWEQN